MPMQRYSSDLNGPSLDEGDSALVGVNEWDAPENIPPGQVQAAVNMDFTSQDAVTRGGFVCLPELGSIPFGEWTERTGIDLSWSGLAFGNNTFVAVCSTLGASEHVMVSSDAGVTWRAVSAVANSWQSVTYGNGLFVAVAAGVVANQVMTSPDGEVWTARTEAATLDWRSVAYGNGWFVAVADSGGSERVMRSQDGITWELVFSGGGTLRSVTFGNGVFVAVGQDLPMLAIYSTDDGENWSLGNGCEVRDWESVTYGNGLFVAVAANTTGNTIMTSPTGEVWTPRTSPVANSWTTVAFGDGLFYALPATFYTSGVQAMTSRDGIVWRQRRTPVDQNWRQLAFGAGVFVAVGNGVSVITTTAIDVFGSSIYSDPQEAGVIWTMLAGSNQVGFYAFGRSSRSVAYASGLSVTQQATIVQADNQVFIFRGPDDTPLRWSGNWADEFELATGTIQPATQAVYCQNRLWEIVGKDSIYASDILDFTVFNATDSSFNLSKGDSNFLVTTYPFGDTSMLVFKNRSILLLSGVDGALSDVVASEITRQVGAVGVNAVVSVGPDVVYMSDRNINLITLTTTNNSLQHKTLPLSRNVQKTFSRMNWEYAYKVSMGFYDNKLFVALPLDNSTICNAVVVYNFVTENWFGEWSFDDSLGIAIQNFVVANYLGLQRLHAVTEDGRIFVVGEGPMDVSGTTFAEIAASVTTRAYSFGNQNHIPRRMYIDISTWRPSYSVTAYSDGVGESSEEVSDQTYSRSDSWIFNDSTYNLNNSGDDYNRAGRKDYSCLPSESAQPQSGFLPEAEQEVRLPILTRRKGRLSWLKVANEQGLLRLMTVGFESRAGDRNNYAQAI